MRCLVLFLVLLAAKDAASVSDNSSSLVFQSSETFITTDITTNSSVFHMELDRYRNDGSILFSDWGSLKTVTRLKQTSVIVYGIGWITGFKQINSTHLAATDINNDCLNIVNRKHSTITTLAGQCGRSGDSDGNPGLFYSPWSVELDIRNPGNLLVTDKDNHALKSVNIDTGTVSTIIRSGFNLPQGMAWMKDRLMVLNYHYISEVSWNSDSTATNTMIAGSTTIGYADGSFSLSRFSYPYDIHPFSENLYLVADEGNDKLRLLDFNRRQVHPVCTNSFVSCKESTHIGDPVFSILKTADAVYVGRRHRIIKLTGGLTVHRIPSMSTISSPCQEKNATIRIRDEARSAIVYVDDGYLVRLEPGTHQLFKDNCTIRVNVEKPSYTSTYAATTTPTPACGERNISACLSDRETSANVEFSDGGSGALDNNSGDPQVTITALGAVSGLLVVFVILTVVLVILFIKVKREVHNLRVNNNKPETKSPNTVKLRAPVDRRYEIPTGFIISGRQDYTKLKLGQSAADSHSSGISKGYANMALHLQPSTTAFIRNPRLSDEYDYVEPDVPQLAAADPHSSEPSEGYDDAEPELQLPATVNIRSSTISDDYGYVEPDVPQSAAVDPHNSTLSEGYDDAELYHQLPATVNIHSPIISKSDHYVGPDVPQSAAVDPDSLDFIESSDYARSNISQSPDK